MRKILLVLLTLVACYANGQTKNIALCADNAQCQQANTCQKHAMGNLTVFTNPVVGKGQISSMASTSRIANNQTNPVLKTTFNVDASQSGNYYLLASVLSTYMANNQFQKISVYVNGQYQGLLNSTTADWEIVGIKDKPMVDLVKGHNEIVFSSAVPFYPEVDAIQISKDKNSLITVNEPYNKFKRCAQRTATYADDSYKESWEVTPKQLGIVGNGNATAWQDVPVVYTYHRKISVTSTERYEIHTTPVDDDDYYSVDTYMYLYKIDDPYHYSWTNDNYSMGYHSKIEATLPAGDYYLVIRAKQNQYASNSVPRQGLVNVYCNGALLNEKTAVSGYLVDAPVRATGTVNFFTSKTSASPQLFLIDGDRMVFNSEPYTYYAPADYYWLEGARKKINFRNGAPNWKVLVTSSGAWWIYYGKCDLYAGLVDAPSQYMNKFPNLKSGDAILMAGDDSRYNSAAWAGGITDRNIWIGNSSKGSPFAWNSWDDYFGNKPMRYVGAPTYKRDGGGVRSIVVYSKDDTMNGITHFAVMNHANNQLHGFDCESKIGTWGRITHTEQSLNGTEFGKTYCSYYLAASTVDIQTNALKKASAPQTYTMKQSIDDGLSIQKDVELSLDEEEKVNCLLKMSSSSTFEKKYNDWLADKLLGDEANEAYAVMSEKGYNDLVAAGRKSWKNTFGFLVRRIFDKDANQGIERDLASVLLCDIMAPYYADRMDSIKDAWQKNPYTEDGKYICPTVEYFTKQYVKAILEDGDFAVSASDVDGIAGKDVLGYDGHELFVTLTTDAVASLIIVNSQTGKCARVMDGAAMDKGRHVFDLEKMSLDSGVNICTLDIDGVKYTLKIMK